MLANFQLYGQEHILTLGFFIGVTVLFTRLLRRHPASQRAKAGISLLAFLCFISYPLNQAATNAFTPGANLVDHLPLHLCDITAFLCGIALITRRRLICELAYFWGLAGTTQGLLTPDITHEFPHVAYLSFFLQHGVIVMTALILPLGLGWRPRPNSALRTYILLLGYAVIMFGINHLLQTNYAFVLEKPQGASLLNFLGVWPWYILWSLMIAAVIFYLLELPFQKLRSKCRQT